MAAAIGDRFAEAGAIMRVVCNQGGSGVAGKPAGFMRAPSITLPPVGEQRGTRGLRHAADAWKLCRSGRGEGTAPGESLKRK